MLEVVLYENKSIENYRMRRMLGGGVIVYRKDILSASSTSGLPINGKKYNSKLIDYKLLRKYMSSNRSWYY